MSLEIAFANKSLREICERQLIAERTIGVDSARKLRTRLAEMLEVEYVSELLNGPLVYLDHDPPGRLAIPIGHRLALFISANHVSNPVDRNGMMKWSSVTRIKIVHIGNPYE